MRQAILLIVITAVTALAFASAAAGKQHRSSCPNGWFAAPVPSTAADLLQFPRIAAGLSANPAPYTAQGLIASAAQIDANDDGIFCLKAVSNLRGSSTKAWQYFYLARDNDTAAR